MTNILETTLNASKEKIETKLNASKETIESKLNASKETIESKLNASKETIESKLNTSKETIETKLNTSKETMVKLQDDVMQRATDAKRDIESGRERLRDESLSTLYEVGKNALERAADLAAKVDVLAGPSEKLQQEAAELESAQEALTKPALADYDTLNVKEVIAGFDDLSAYDLEKIERYEKNNKNRKTILREVEKRLA